MPENFITNIRTIFSIQQGDEKFKRFFGFFKNCANPKMLSFHPIHHRCFATPKSIPKLKTLITSALTEFFYVNIYVFFCCILLRFT